MLNPEQARARLEVIRLPDWRRRLRRRVNWLPARLRKIGRELLEDTYPWAVFAGPGEFWEGKLLRAYELDQMAPDDRRPLFEVLFPKLARYVEAAWQQQIRLPFQAGWAPKPFRAPHAPFLSLPKRHDRLRDLIGALGGHEQDITWVAAWAAYLGPTGPLLAAAIDAGGTEGDQVFEILCDSARGEHEIGAMGHHVIQALLVASRPEGWEFMEKLLLAAQREEGLRQAILETVDEAHVGAFVRMLRVILEHNLARFSAIVRAVDVWFGYQWDAASVGVVNAVLKPVVRFLEDPEARQQALDSDQPETAYLALWATAFEDAEQAVGPAARLLADTKVERRFVAAYLLTELGTGRAEETLLRALEDQDLRVVMQSLQAFAAGACKQVQEGDLFERLEAVSGRLPEKKKKLEPIVWPWAAMVADRRVAARSLRCNLGDRPPTRLIPYLAMMQACERAQVVESLAAGKRWNAEVRDTLFAMAGDASGTVREQALLAIQHCKVTEQEAVRMEAYLTRKPADLRRGAVILLFNRKDRQVLASVDRLLDAPMDLQRLAGLELLRRMAEARRAVPECRRRAGHYRAQQPQLSDEERKQLDAVLDTRQEPATLDNALGLMDPRTRTKPTPPRKRKVVFFTPAARACLQSLDDLIHEHRETPVTVKSWEGQKEELLGNLHWEFPSAEPRGDLESDLAALPLRELWQQWWREHGPELSEPDGLGLIRARAMISLNHNWSGGLVGGWLMKARKQLTGRSKLIELRYSHPVSSILDWLLRMYPPPGSVDFLLDGLEAILSRIPKSQLARVAKYHRFQVSCWRDYGSVSHEWLELARRHRSVCPACWQADHHVRLWGLLRWIDEPGTTVPRHRPELREVMAAFEAGGAGEADVLDQLIGPRDMNGWGRRGFPDLRELTVAKPPAGLPDNPVLRQLVERCRQRILEIELGRGETPTAASAPALDLSFAGGLEVLVPLLQALGKENFLRRWSYDGLSRASVFSHLIRMTLPAAQDTLEAFASQMKAAGVSPRRLIELAVYAPQWAAHVERALGWPEFAEAVWWIHAHTKDMNWSVDQQIRDTWKAQISERTPLTGQDLLEGAVDVAWFNRVRAALGADRWGRLDAAAKYASGGGGHKRAQLFADAMLGGLEKAELVTRITEKRHQDAVRALGLRPLAKGAARRGDLLERYHLLQEFLRTGRKFGAQRQIAEKRAVEIGMQNLARTAGYPDPLRLQWAMEAQAVADLAAGPVTVKVNEVEVSLALDDQGRAELSVTKKNKPLKSIPAAARKNPEIANLRARKTELKRQGSRMRLALEQAMCRGDVFSGSELRELFDHPVLATMLERLVLIGDGVIGYPGEKGRVLRDHAGRLEPVKKRESLRIAHAHDLLATQQWHEWQRECFQNERIQPFKQVFRELYVLTEAERSDGGLSHRYAGHQVHPRQALALLGGRGWLSRPHEGVHRTFHNEDLTAWIGFLEPFYTPAQIEGLTLETVLFCRRGKWEPLPLADVPPRIFSEVMRDLDLVVSVAHRGGVDPEASASTVEMRAALLRETCGLLEITNVRVQGPHALIDGRLGNYSVHLGSAVTHRQPGGMLLLVPVHSQHRGRLFLPFADDDPKTAEVLSKTILLARDDRIKDPNILGQIFTAH